MAKNDYFVIMYRILAYMYSCLKSGEKFDKEAVSYEMLDIPQSYWTSVIENMIDHGYIKGAEIIIMHAGIKGVKWISPEIAQEGVKSLEENLL